jgi:hypothetical protein
MPGGYLEMRKQYHLRPSPLSLLAWDVDRLIELTTDSPRVEVPLGAIVSSMSPSGSEVGLTKPPVGPSRTMLG